MTDRPRRLLLQRIGPRFEQEPEASLYHALHSDEIAVERRILIEANNLLADHIPHLSAAVRCALRQALEKQS